MTVVSPHLDDAVLSVGGTIHRLTSSGVGVTVVTVFAGDPEAATPPSYWDAGRGAATQADAVRARRREDHDALRVLGATATALPWSDSGYAARRDPDAIWADLGPLLRSADLVLLPGWPLTHADHRYTTILVLERVTWSLPVGFYAEQPYAAEPLNLAKAMIRGRTVAPLRHLVGDAVQWRRMPVGVPARRAQAEALRHYAGELVKLGRRGRWARTLQGLTRGEWLGSPVGATALDLLDV